MIASFAVFIGSFILAYSLVFIAKICHIATSVGWKLLCGLVCFFICCYIGYGYYLWQASTPTIVEYALCVILFFGSVFVAVVSLLSYSSLVELNNAKRDAQYRADHDFLTKIKNRKKLQETSVELIAAHRSFSFMLIDLNSFKEVNDKRGHAFGDQLLVAVAKKMESALLKGNQLFRIGGDEFAILLDTVNIREIYAQNNTLLSHLGTGIKIAGVSLDVRYSAGVSIFLPDLKRDIDQIMQQADVAMYAAKRSQQSIIVYDEEIHNQKKVDNHLHTQSETVFASQCLETYYEPIISAANGDLYGVETRFAWPLPNGNVVTMTQLSAIAHENNRTKSFVSCLLDNVFTDSALLLKTNSQLRIHAELPLNGIPSGLLISTLANCLDQYCIDPSRLVFEITLGSLEISQLELNQLLETLKEMGFGVGGVTCEAGYANPSEIQNLPLSHFKLIGQSIDPVKSRATFETYVYFGKKLGCMVRVANINTDADYDYANSLSSDYLQGGLFSEPLRVKEMINWITSYHATQWTIKKLKPN
ncbi:diguanylate cyclase domain-containing protein [Pseudoalteromonas sp. T1lg65]|uniref:diguanylate cyclase domain-containing protein n=1 Tax=Pseudoalteromonas sp. T1lg65 TaxID=2077101 RepID=UPI003F79FEF3